jgi:hypothetical protein
MECILEGETEVFGENLPQHHFCPSTNPTWTDPGLNPGRRGGEPATNRLSCGAAMCLLIPNVLFETALQVFFRRFAFRYTPPLLRRLTASSAANKFLQNPHSDSVDKMDNDFSGGLYS